MMRISRSYVLIAVAFLLLASCGGEADRPNVIVLVMDTARADRCSVNGYARETTPELEKLAAEGLKFTNAWTTSGWTGPAHASLFTGLQPAKHGFFTGNREYLDKRAVTLAERMRKAGYRTACFSNNSFVSAECGLTQGFQKVVPLFEDLNRPYPPSPETHSLAMEWIREVRAADGRFFVFINDIEPHLPYRPPEEFAARFLDPTLDEETVQAARLLTPMDWHRHNLGVKRLPQDQIRALQGLYDAEIACLDHEVGKLVEALREDGVLDDTLLVVTSDHGECLGEHGMLSHEFGLYRSLRHVPLVLRLPGGTRAGEVLDDVVRLEDIYATVEEACRLPARRSIDGQSLLGDVSGRRARAMRGNPHTMLERMRQEDKLVFDPTRLAVGITADFDGRYHRIEYSDGRTELFDIEADPSESRSLD